MKLLLILFISFTLTLQLTFNSVNQGRIDGRSFGDTVGEAYNSEDHEDIVAVTYGIALNRNAEKPMLGYKPPQLVEKLPDIIVPPSQGPLESVDELPTVTTYYDGSLKLNVAQMNCKVYTIPGSCVKQSSCGWCGDSKSCVKGTALAPLEPCDSSSYQFNFNFNPTPAVAASSEALPKDAAVASLQSNRK